MRQEIYEAWEKKIVDCIKHYPNKTSMTTLMKKLHATYPTIQRYVEIMEEKGVIVTNTNGNERLITLKERKK